MNKAQVGNVVWYEGNPCNMHLLDLTNKVHEGVEGFFLALLEFVFFFRRI